jgi:hypothetical protein
MGGYRYGIGALGLERVGDRIGWVCDWAGENDAYVVGLGGVDYGGCSGGGGCGCS